MFDSIVLSGIFISLLAGQFARIELINSLANIYVHEFILLFFVLMSIFRAGIKPIQKVLKSPVFIVLAFIIVISYGISFTEFTFLQNSIAFLYLARLVLYSVFGIYLVDRIRHNKKISLLISNYIFTFSILLLGASAIQYLFFPNSWVLYALGWDPHLYRASAAYFDVFIAAALYGIFALYWFSQRKWILSFLFVVALVFSFSRSGYVAFIITLVYFFASQKKWKELVLGFGLFVLLIVFVPKPFGEGVNLLRTSSINSRILDYRRGVELWLKKPIFGFGYNRIRFAKEQTNLALTDDRSHSLASFHSSFLMILVSTGAVGLAVSLYGLVLLFKRYPFLRSYLVYIGVMSLFDNVLLHVLVVLPLLFIGVVHHSSLE